MKLRDLTEEVVMDAIQEFYDEASIYMNSIAKLVANERYAIPRTPRRLGIAEFPYFYAVDLYQLFGFARGRLQMSPAHVTKKCDEVMTLLYTTMSGELAEPNWETFKGTAMGVAILACSARIHLREDEGLMSGREVMLLSSWSQKNLMRSGLEEVQTNVGQRYRSADVRQVFKGQSIPV